MRKIFYFILIFSLNAYANDFICPKILKTEDLSSSFNTPYDINISQNTLTDNSLSLSTSLKLVYDLHGTWNVWGGQNLSSASLHCIYGNGLLIIGSNDSVQRYDYNAFQDNINPNAKWTMPSTRSQPFDYVATCETTIGSPEVCKITFS